MRAFSREEIRTVVREVLVELGFRVGPGASALPRKRDPRPEGPRTLVLFTAGVRRREQALAEVRRIQETHGRLGVFTGPSVRDLVCGADLKDRAGVACVLDTVKPEGLEAALAHADILLLPTFCYGVAARASRLLQDTLESRLLVLALLHGKRVLATRDGFSLLDAPVNPAIREEIEKTLTRLGSFGVLFCDTQDLSRTFDALAGSLSGGTPGATARPGLPLVTARDVTACVERGEKTLSVAPGGKVTPLARDLAAERGVTLIGDRGRRERPGSPKNPA